MGLIKKIIPKFVKKFIKELIFLSQKYYAVIMLIVKRPKQYFKLNKAERKLFADPWYNNFHSLGLRTQQKDEKDRLNQDCKQGIIFGLIDQALGIVGGPPVF
jgi:hypothetical protein